MQITVWGECHSWSYLREPQNSDHLNLKEGRFVFQTTTFQGCCCENFGYVYFERARSNMIPTQSTDLWPFTREFRSVIGPWDGLSCCLSFSPRANVKITSTGSIMDPVIHALATVRQCSWMIQNEYWYWLMVLVIKRCRFSNSHCRYIQ